MSARLRHYCSLLHCGQSGELYVLYLCFLFKRRINWFIASCIIIQYQCTLYNSGLGITAGAHRLWAHRSYEAAFLVRLFLMLCNSMANQASIYQWVKDHRVHHMYSETHADPHNSKRGFFFAHIGWLYLKRHPDNIRAEKELDLSDLENDPVVMIQRWGFGQWRFHWVIAIYMWWVIQCLYPLTALSFLYYNTIVFILPARFIFPAQFAVKFWGESYWLAFFVAGALRYVFVLHCTFLVSFKKQLM